MRRELSGTGWNRFGMGTLAAPDGRTYARRSTRVDRREAAALVESGCPVVSHLPGGRVVRHDEDDAWPAWADARTALTTGVPAGDGEAVTAGRWESPGGASVVVLVRHG